MSEVEHGLWCCVAQKIVRVYMIDVLQNISVIIPNKVEQTTTPFHNLTNLSRIDVILL